MHQYSVVSLPLLSDIHIPINCVQIYYFQFIIMTNEIMAKTERTPTKQQHINGEKKNRKIKRCSVVFNYEKSIVDSILALRCGTIAKNQWANVNWFGSVGEPASEWVSEHKACTSHAPQAQPPRSTNTPKIFITIKFSFVRTPINGAKINWYACHRCIVVVVVVVVAGRGRCRVSANKLEWRKHFSGYCLVLFDSVKVRDQ